MSNTSSRTRPACRHRQRFDDSSLPTLRSASLKTSLKSFNARLGALSLKFITGFRVALLSALAIAPAFAADPRPDAVIKNRNIDARVFLDDSIKADAALAADCLAEGKKWLDKNAADA